MESSDFNSNNSKDKLSNIGRFALSKNICRFELPMDMTEFERMDPLRYIEKYCRISDRRKALYRRVFERYKLKADGEEYIDIKLFEDCLIEVHMKSITKTQVNQIISIVGLTPNQRINLQLFCGLAALSERVLFENFVTEDTIDLPDYQKDKIECVDFASLNSKLDGVKVNEKMMQLLRLI